MRKSSESGRGVRNAYVITEQFINEAIIYLLNYKYVLQISCADAEDSCMACFVNLFRESVEQSLKKIITSHFPD